MKTFAPLALALGAVLVGSGAAAQPPPAHRPPTGHACFWRRDVENFNALDDTTLYLRVAVSQIWELKLFGNCFDLSWLHHIGLETFPGDSDICEGTNPGVNVVVHELGIGRQQCPATRLRKLTPAEAAAIPKSARP